MSDLLKSLESRVSPADWQRMATQAKMSTDELKSKVHAALQEEAKLAVETLQDKEKSSVTALHPKLGDETSVGSCVARQFEISIYKAIGVKGTFKLCGTSSTDWSAELDVCLIVAGASVWCTHYKFDPHNLSVCFNPDLELVEAKLCFTLVLGNGKICLKISGKACYWALGWHCADFDTTLLCLPI